MGAGSSIFSNAGNLATSATSTDPYTQSAQRTAVGNLAGAQNATAANRINQTTPYQSLQYSQTGTDANGNPIWGATQSLAPQFQGSLSNLAQNVGQTTQNAFNPTNLPSMGINPGENYSDAIMRRLQPQIQHQTEMSDAQLANQGIVPGTEAYTNAKRVLGQQQNDLLTSAQIGGIGVGQQANQQAYNQQLQTYNNPLQQLGAFNQATQAGYVTPYNQAAVAGPDYLGAQATSNAAAIAAQNAANAQTANMQSGLYGLGSSAILGAGGLGNLGTSAINGLTSLGNFFGYQPNISGAGGSAIDYASQLGDPGNYLGV